MLTRLLGSLARDAFAGVPVAAEEPFELRVPDVPAFLVRVLGVTCRLAVIDHVATRLEDALPIVLAVAIGLRDDRPVEQDDDGAGEQHAAKGSEPRRTPWVTCHSGTSVAWVGAVSRYLP